MSFVHALILSMASNVLRIKGFLKPKTFRTLRMGYTFKKSSTQCKFSFNFYQFSEEPYFSPIFTQKSFNFDAETAGERKNNLKTIVDSLITYYV